ncbi:MAG: flippase-like domain-containing protein [Candidatus Hydrogenedentes bacterium]|nr:flippase-like domain-containing protein [Candidatus Hydrogenedentota bacterium]
MNSNEQETDQTPGEVKRSHYRKLLWIAGISLYLGAVWTIGWERIRAAMKDVDGVTICVMVLVTLAALWIRALKWRIALGPGNNSVGIFFLSKAAGEWSPARMGEFSPLLIRKHRTARIAAWILVDRVLEMASTVGIGLFGLAFVSLPNRSALIVTGVLLCLGFAGALMVLANASYWERLASRITSKGRLQNLVSLAPKVAREVRSFGSTAVYTGVLTLIAGILDVWAGRLLYVAFGYPIPMHVSAASKGIHAIVSAVPVTPNATGVPYFAAATLIHETGHVPTPVLAAGVALGILLTNLLFWGSVGVGAADFRKRASEVD